MSVKEEVIQILHSRGRIEKTDPDIADLVANLIAAVREVQDAVVKLAEEVDELREQSS